MEEQERLTLRRELEDIEKHAKESLAAMRAALEDIAHAVWPFPPGARDLDEARSPEELADSVDRLEQSAESYVRGVEMIVDAAEHCQGDLCRRLAVFEPEPFEATVKDVLRVFFVPAAGYWRVHIPSAGDATATAVLARRAVRACAPGWVDLTGAVVVEAEVLARARHRLEEMRTMVDFGGQCVNHDCPRFEYLGQQETCDHCGQRTVCSNGTTDLGKAREALA